MVYMILVFSQPVDFAPQYCNYVLCNTRPAMPAPNFNEIPLNLANLTDHRWFARENLDSNIRTRDDLLTRDLNCNKSVSPQLDYSANLRAPLQNLTNFQSHDIRATTKISPMIPKYFRTINNSQTRRNYDESQIQPAMPPPNSNSLQSIFGNLADHRKFTRENIIPNSWAQNNFLTRDPNYIGLFCPNLTILKIRKFRHKNWQTSILRIWRLKHLLIKKVNFVSWITRNPNIYSRDNLNQNQWVKAKLQMHMIFIVTTFLLPPQILRRIWLQILIFLNLIILMNFRHHKMRKNLRSFILANPCQKP